MKKILIICLVMFASFSSAFAQEIEIKDNKVFFDGKEILKYEKVNNYEHSFYSLENNDEVLFFKIFDNNPKTVDDDTYVLNFLMEKVKVNSGDFSRFASLGSMKKAMKKLLVWLVKEKVIGSDGKINKEKLAVFYEKYHEANVNSQ